MPYGPDDENTSSFGFDLASSTNCFTLFTGSEGWTTMISGSAANRARGAIWSSVKGDWMPYILSFSITRCRFAVVTRML